MKPIFCLSLVLTFCGCGGAGTRNVPSVAAVPGAAAAVAPAPEPAPVTPKAAPAPEFQEGKLATIRGHYVPESAKRDYYSSNMTQNLFEVTAIDGKPASLRVELVDPPAAPKSSGNKEPELTLVGYFYRQVATGSLVEGFDPPGTQGHGFFYTTKFRVKRPTH